MSAEILDNRHTIDLTGIDTDEDDDEVIFMGSSHPERARTPLQPTPVLQQRFNPPGGWRPQPREHEEAILIESDDDEQEEQAVDRLIPPQPQPQNPPVQRHDPMRIFSPPAQFRQDPPRDDAFYQRRPTPHPYGDPHLAPRPPAPRPPSVHNPRIGLGGGFLAIRERGRPINSHNRDNEIRDVPHWIRFIRDMAPGNLLYPPPPRPPVQVEIPILGGMVWDAGRNEAIGGPVDFQPWHIAGDDRLDPPKPTYGPIITHHKEKPSPGFTFDFEPSATAENAPIVIDVEESQPSSSSSSSGAVNVATPSLICARCNTTLRMGSKTMWGLRCGHVICGECGEYLSKPVEGKGKGKAEEEEAAAPPQDVKGKGKARALKQRSKPARAARTRTLRASTLQASAESAQAQSSSTSAPTTAVPASVARKRKAGRKNDTKPVLLEEYEYACPVEGCFRPHFTEKWKQPKKVSKERDDGIVEMEVVWKPKADMGAIPIFT